MVENLMIQSIESDNRNVVNFSDKYLPRFGRHGELFVVNGILYIFADFDNSNHGKWFPLSDAKEIFSYVQHESAYIWNIPIDFQTDNVQVIVYDENDKVYPYNFTIDISERNIQIIFEQETKGSVHLIVNKAFDWVDRRFIVADRNFAVTEDSENINLYYLEIDTAYVKILKNGNTTFEKDVVIEGKLNVSSITNVNKLIVEVDTWIQGGLEVDGNLVVRTDAVIEGNLTINGTTTTVDTTEISLSDNKIVLNSDFVGVPVTGASIDINRGDEGIISIISFDETLDIVTIPEKQQDGSFIQYEISTKPYVSSSILVETERALLAEGLLETNLNDTINRLDNEITRSTNAESLLQTDIDTKAPISNTYTKPEIDTLIETIRVERDNIIADVNTSILESVPTAEETLTAIKSVDGAGSGLNADMLDGFDADTFNQTHGVTESVTAAGAEVISKLVLEDGVVVDYEKRNITLSDLGYTEQQAVSTIIGLQEIINNITARIEILESKIQ